MKYSWNLNNYCIFKCFEINRETPKSYFVPYKNKEEADGISLTQYRYKSSVVESLNGTWDFLYYENPNEFPKEGDTSTLKWDKIDVPSCSQARGYGKPYYTNIKYQFPINPPKIPTLKPVGLYFGFNNSNPTKMHFEIHNVKDSYNSVFVYRRNFIINDINKDFTLKFLGVAPCFDLFINGEFVGYAEGSHNISDFNINKFANEGNNELVVVIHRWCNSTYLEDQDMFRYNGIFRDVLLYKEDKTRINDFEFITSKNESTYSFKLHVYSFKNDKDVNLHVSLKDKSNNVIYDSISSLEEFNSFEKDHLKVKEWNAEEPNLYVLEMELSKDNKVFCYIKKYVGFKKIEIKKDIYYFNNRNIKFKGVNHHDSTPHNGYTMSSEEIEKDIKICKEYGFNAIRTSHYPPDPLLIELANVYGLYIVAEADLETHGMQMFTSSSGRISNNLKWANHFVDRAKRLYEPLKNEPCIAMWSLGNECGGVKCHLEMAKYLKSRTDIPLHLESAIHKKIVHYDVTSMMYPSIPLVHKVGSKTLKKNDRNKKMMETPFFLCEYAHAMGVGPGCLEEYVDEFYKYDSLMGGCIWEFADHAVLHENGPYKYTYGGDHGEYFHDGNFCCDGLFYPDRKPSSGAINAKYCYRPLRFKHIENNRFEVHNTNAFLSADNYEIFYNVIANNVRLKTNKLHLSTPAWSKENFDIPSLDLSTDCRVEFSYYLKENKETFFIDQLNIKELIYSQFNNSCDKLLITNNKNDVTISNAKGKVTFDFKKATISSYEINGLKLIKGPNEHSLMRVNLDNDAYDMIFWNLSGLSHLKNFSNKLSIYKTDNKLLIKTTHILRKRFYRFVIEDEYLINNDLQICVTSTLKNARRNTVLPRFSTIYNLNKELKTVKTLARKDETYCDFKNHSPICEYSKNFNDFMEPNIKPQESGNRTDARFVEITNNGQGIGFYAVEHSFEFSLKQISDGKLAKAKHIEDVNKENDSYLTISKFNLGVGTGICGPKTLPKYTNKASRDYILKYIIKPIVNK